MKRYLCWIGLLGLLGGCFNEREPERPDTATEWISPTEPEILLDNFRRATTELNVNNYRRCFDEAQFTFVAAPEVQGNNVGLFQQWTLDREELDYLLNIQEQTLSTNGNRLTFTDEARIFYTPDSLEYNADYELQIFHQDNTFQFYTFRGNIILVMTRDLSNEWSINTWADNKNTNDPCWTELKEHFVVR